MKHLIICNEYPPTPRPGGIGTYAKSIACLLADVGETVHVIAQALNKSSLSSTESHQGKLIVHRVPFIEGRIPPILQFNRQVSLGEYEELDGLFQSHFPPQTFSWQAALLAEKLVEEENIDIIEAQEFQAPLYYFQLRRALGLGPKKQPPCIIHLHSPTEYIASHNNWDINFPFFQTAKRMEDFTIGAADALLCPSKYFAHQAETHYKLTSDSIKIIPLPIGETPYQERDLSVWESGSLCYVGRLEERKGVVEWIEAAVSIADEFPDVTFEFIGANCLGTQRISSEEFINQRIPKRFRSRFIFRGNQERANLPNFLKQARISVVPSRWENFPNTCVEAMCSGLPVLASCEGGMVEMIEDGKTGWLANEPGVEGLRKSLIRAVTTDPTTLARMGKLAAQQIRQKCSNDQTIEKHIEYRSKVVAQGTQQFSSIPINLPSYKLFSLRKEAKNDEALGIVFVVSFPQNRRFLKDCLKHLKNQSISPLTVFLLSNENTSEKILEVFEHERLTNWENVHINKDEHSALFDTIENLLTDGLKPIGIASIKEGDFVRPEFSEICELVLQKNPSIGIVSCWSKYLGTRDKIWISSNPAFPYQWVDNEVAPFSVIRTEVFLEASRAIFSDPSYTYWNFVNSIMMKGWVAVTVPKVLVTSLSIWGIDFSHIESPHLHAILLKKIYENFSEMTKEDLKEISILAISKETWVRSSVFTRVKLLLNKTEILFFYSKNISWYLMEKLVNQFWSTTSSIKRKVFG